MRRVTFLFGAGGQAASNQHMFNAHLVSDEARARKRKELRLPMSIGLTQFWAVPKTNFQQLPKAIADAIVDPAMCDGLNIVMVTLSTW